MRTTTLNKDQDSWLTRIKQLIHHEPQNKEELIRLLRDAHLRSLIDSETLAMIEGVILFAKMKVRDIMLPKKQMICIHEGAELNDIIQIINQSGHSRFPVLSNNSDEIIGILHAKDMLRYQTSPSSHFNLDDVVRQAPVVPESKRLDLLLAEFRSHRNHMAIVVDEYGLVAGFVTLEDIIEQIIGDIEDEFDIDEEAYIKTHKDKHYIIKAHTPVEEFNEQLQANFSTDSFATIGGIVMDNFGYLPTRGESITIDGFEFKIINADARRIKLLSCRDVRTSQTE